MVGGVVKRWKDVSIVKELERVLDVDDGIIVKPKGGNSPPSGATASKRKRAWEGFEIHATTFLIDHA